MITTVCDGLSSFVATFSGITVALVCRGYAIENEKHGSDNGGY